MQLAVAQPEEVGEEFIAAIARLRALDRRGVDPGATGELAHDRPARVAARDFSSIDVCSPEHRRTAMDKEPGRRIAMSYDAVGPGAEHPVGHFLVGCDPASGVWPPAELGERDVEPGCEGGQYDLGVELPDSLL